MYDAFTALDTVVVALAQEDTDLEKHGTFFKGLDEPFPFDVVADLNREVTLGYDRTTAYLIDKQGVVREIFPAMIQTRPSWRAVLNRIDALQPDSES